MIDKKTIYQVVFSELCGHPEAKNLKQRALSGNLKSLNAVTKEISRCLNSLTINILKTVDDQGKPMLDTPEAWQNFDKVVSALESCGVKLSYEDFLRPIGEPNGKTLLELAVAHNGIEKIFSLQVWHGRFDEMQRVWFLLPLKDRNEIIKNLGPEAMKLKRQIFAEEGRIVPEDRLMKAGLLPADVRLAFTGKGNLDELNKKLQAVGDFLCKEFALMPDSYGDTVFDSRKDAWERYAALVGIMRENGERFEVADFLCQYWHAQSILARAAEHNALDKVFTPAHWKDRLKDMLELWSAVLDAWKVGSMMTRDFDNAYAEAESLTYMPQVSQLPIVNRQALLTQLNPGDVDEKPIIPLGLKAVWEKMDIISQVLAVAGETLTIEDLRRTSGEKGESCLISAAKYGYFDKVYAVCRESKSALTVDDFLSRDSSGVMLIDHLAERNQLALAFDPKLWVKRINDMHKLWSHVAARYRTKVDYERVVANVRRELLKEKSKATKKNPRFGPNKPPNKS